MKLRHGKRTVKRPTLPPAARVQDEQIVISKPAQRIGVADGDLPPDIALLISQISSSSTSIRVPKNPKRLHPLIARWQAEDEAETHRYHPGHPSTEGNAYRKKTPTHPERLVS
jgi:hypothetical protein